jgi:hypothetical protein
MSKIDHVFIEFTQAWERGDMPGVDEFLTRVMPEDRNELSEQIATYLMIAPEPRYDEGAWERLRSDPVAQQLAALLQPEPRPRPSSLPRVTPSSDAAGRLDSAHMSVLHLQDPSVPGRSLLDLLTEAADGAERGGGIFAFASKAGVRMFLDDSVVRKMLKRGTLELVVGVDAVTNEAALAELRRAARRQPNLRARALMHDLPTLFHPKLAWFVQGEEIVVIVGSGNLTPGGLTNNFEAFNVSTYARRFAEAQMTDWLARWDPWLFALDDPAVVARAKQNSGSERSLRQPMPRESEEPGPPPDIGLAADALVAEITKNAPNRTQVDIGRTHFTSFFGGEPGRKKRILIQHVGPGGVFAELERPRSLIETKSDNYRFEAGGRGRKAYPTSGRPIGVFVRFPDGVFRYKLIWPGESGHEELTRFLTHTEGADGVRRHATRLASLRAAWPDCPF